MTSSPWRDELVAAVARGLREDGWDAVVDALGEQADLLSSHPDAPIEALCPEYPVLALNGCETGRLGIAVNTDGRVSVHLGRSSAAVLEQVREGVEPALVVFTGTAEADAEADADAPFATEVVERYDGPDTLQERREFLRLAGLNVPAWFSGSGFTETELLDACGAVVVALARTGRMQS